MLLICLAKLTGVPLGGAPVIQKNGKITDISAGSEEGAADIGQAIDREQNLYIRGVILSRTQTAKTVQYVLEDAVISEKKISPGDSRSMAKRGISAEYTSDQKTENQKQAYLITKLNKIHLNKIHLNKRYLNETYLNDKNKTHLNDKNKTHLNDKNKIHLKNNHPDNIINTKLTDQEIFHNMQMASYAGLHTGRIIVRDEKGSDLAIGSEIVIFGDPEVIRGPGNPGEFDLKSYYAASKIFFSVRAKHVEVAGKQNSLKYRLREKMTRCREKAARLQQEVMDQKSAGVLSGMLLGDREFLQEESKIDFRLGGLTHVLAISGLHISFLGNGIFVILQYAGLPLAAAAPLSAIMMFLYCLFAGSPVSAVRAAIMFAVMTGARMTKRSYDTLSALALAAILMLLYEPHILFYAGFQMSVAAVAGAAVVYPVLNGMIPQDFWRRGSPEKRYLEKVMEAAFLYISITLATVPLTAFYFYEIPLMGLFTNVVLVPMTGMILCAGVAGSVVLFLAGMTGIGACGRLFAKIALFPADMLLRIFGKTAGAIRELPLTTWICGQPSVPQLFVFYACLTISMILLRARRRRKKLPGRILRSEKTLRLLPYLLLSAGIFILFFRIHEPLKMTMLSVGQGDGLVIQHSGTVYIVDGGSSDESNVGKYTIIPCLKQQGITHVEGIFLSHGDADHYNGIEEILESIRNKELAVKVKYLMMPCWMKEDETGKRLCQTAEKAGVKVRYLSTGDKIVDKKGKEMTIGILFPGEDYQGSGNEASMTMELELGSFSALLTGDLEGEGEKNAIHAMKDVDVLKVGHHGSRNATSEEMLKICSPEVCLISAPKNSRYGHPHQETLDRIKNAGADYFVTKDLGAVTVISDGKQYRIIREGG